MTVSGDDTHTQRRFIWNRIKIVEWIDSGITYFSAWISVREDLFCAENRRALEGTCDLVERAAQHDGKEGAK